MTATQLIYRGLRMCREGLARAGRGAAAEQLTDGLARLNDMLDAWGAERLTMYVLLRTVNTLTSTQASYSIGSGGDINIVRPEWIEAAGLILDLTATTPTEDPIEVLTEQRWQAIRQKTLTNTLARAIYYDHGWTAGLGRVYPWPIPTISTTQLVLYTPQALTAFADLTTNYTFPPGYAEAIGYQLALRLAPEFGGLKEPAAEGRAAKALARVKIANVRPVRARLDPSTPGLTTGHIFDWRTSEFR